MFKLGKYCIYFIVSLFLLSSCADQKEYNRILKSENQNDKLEYAHKCFEAKNYKRAIEVYELLLPIYRGREQSQQILHNLAYASFYEQDYFMAAYYFKNLSRQYPNYPKIEEIVYMSAFSKSLESPYYKLDQRATEEAIKELQLFVNYYPNSSKVEEANVKIEALREKLAEKAFHIAAMYYRRELYNASAIAYTNFIKDFPASPLREQAYYYLVKSRYLYAKNSIESKQADRYEKVIESYKLFVRSYKNSSYQDEVEKYYQLSQKKIESNGLQKN